jgi:hypothetical protein
MELIGLPDVFAMRWIADRWQLISPDPRGPHGGWLRLPLSERDLSCDPTGGHQKCFTREGRVPPGRCVRNFTKKSVFASRPA